MYFVTLIRQVVRMLVGVCPKERRQILCIYCPVPGRGRTSKLDADPSVCCSQALWITFVGRGDSEPLRDTPLSHICPVLGGEGIKYGLGYTLIWEHLHRAGVDCSGEALWSKCVWYGWGPFRWEGRGDSFARALTADIPLQLCAGQTVTRQPLASDGKHIPP